MLINLRFITDFGSCRRNIEWNLYLIKYSEILFDTKLS